MIGAEVAWPRSLYVCGVAVGGISVGLLLHEDRFWPVAVGTYAIGLTVAYLLGDASRRRREVLTLYRERAEQSERTHAEVAKRAAAEERSRIARELHDIVAHSMSVIAVQSGTGRLVIEQDPSRAAEALTVIEETSRSALDEMRRLLGVLRSDDAMSSRAPTRGSIPSMSWRRGRSPPASLSRSRSEERPALVAGPRARRLSDPPRGIDQRHPPRPRRRGRRGACLRRWRAEDRRDQHQEARHGARPTTARASGSWGYGASRDVRRNRRRRPTYATAASDCPAAAHQWSFVIRVAIADDQPLVPPDWPPWSATPTT